MRDQFTGEGISLERAVSFWIARVYASNRAELYRRFRSAGLSMTPEQWMVLVKLWEGEGLSQSELASSTLRDAPTLSRILDVMEREGLIDRKPDPCDARSRRVYLTDRGKSLRKTLVPLARALVADLEQGIPEADLQVTRRTLQRMFENLSR